MKNNLHTELRPIVEKIIWKHYHPSMSMNGEEATEEIVEAVISKLDEQLSTSPDSVVKSVVKQDTLESLNAELSLLQWNGQEWLAQSNVVATGDEGTSHYIYATGPTIKEALENLLKELKK